MPSLDDIGLQLADLFQNFDGFFQTFLEGDKDEGFNSTGGTTGVLGYYPYVDPDEETVYRPCLARVIANAVAASGRGAAHIGLVDIGQYMGYLPGQTGSFVLVPVIEGDVAVRLSEQESLLLPKVGQPQALLFAQPSDDGIMVTIGAANAPIPQPPGPSEPLDLGSGGVIYAPLGEITPLNIAVPAGLESFEIDVPEDLDLVIGSTEDILVPVSLSLDFAEPVDPEDPTAGPWVISGDSMPVPVNLIKDDNVSDPITFDESNYPTTSINSGFHSGGLGIELPFNDDPNLDRVPDRFTIDFVGKTRKATGIVCMIMDAPLGFIGMYSDYGGFRLNVWGPAGGADCLLYYDVDESEVHSYRAEWTNDPDGPGGFAELFVDGVSAATATLNRKPIISSSSALYLNNALGNFANSVDGLTYHSLTLGYNKPDIAYNYEAFVGTTIVAEDIVRLAVDARTVTEQQPVRTISYNAPDGPEATLEVVVGDVELPVGRAYKAILMTYPDGVEAGPVGHPNELVMTKFTAQNVRFEDEELFHSQPSWSECIPQGEPPVIDGIAYNCDAIRIGNYVQFQFGYHLDEETNPVEPFGDLNAIDGLSTYMVPHKWYIYDQHGELMGRVEQPGGEPLNRDYALPMWQGPTGIRASAYTTPSTRWAPSGTIGSAVIWASHDLVDHDREEVQGRIPIPEQIVPMASHIDYSVNGFDPRLGFTYGTEGNMNGFGNWRVMPYERSDYQTWVAAAPSEDPYTGLDGVASRGPNGAIWLKYSPFNIQGRSPITGPGGVRDDRQPIAEPVSAYLAEPDGAHLVNGASYRQIAIDYCRGYASDPFHLFEDGRNVPLFKGKPRRNIVLNGHYYGTGDLGQPWANRFPLYIGRAYSWVAGAGPTKVQDYLGSDQDHPWRGLFGIDETHAHQFPGWGSLLWKSPEFAFLQIKFFEQVRMYQGGGGYIFGRWAGANLQMMHDRGGAWSFLHTALAWKLGSARSQRLYTRQEIMEWTVNGFEAVYDNLFETTPGIFNLPVAGQASSGSFNARMMTQIHALNLFGMCGINDGLAIYQQSFMRGYWITALGCGERMGFNAALREASPKAAAVLDWLIAKWRQAIVGNLTKISTHLPENSASNFLWTPAQVEALWPEGMDDGATMGDVSLLPQTYEELEATNGVFAKWDFADEGYPLDGQGMSADLSAPFWMKNVLGLSGEDIDAACAIARARFDGKLSEQEALGAAGGSTWFAYHQGSFTPPLPIDGEPTPPPPPPPPPGLPEGSAWVVDGTGNYVFDEGDQVYVSEED